MFSDESQEVITLPSSWRVERSLVDAGCQTKDLKYAEISTQSIEKHEIEGQTEEDTKENENFSLLEDTSQALSNFLLRVYPDVCEQLIANNRSNAFDGYDVNWEDEFEAITCPFKLFHKEAEHKFEVTSISWNSRGSVIAVAYGRNDHEGWCTHRSLLCSWNIDMRNINMEKADRSLDVECCLTSVAFHPEHPPLLAAGTFTGELIIWDLSQDDDNFITNSSHRDETHQEPITKVFWLPNTSLRSRRYKLVSASCDGKLFLWEFNQISKKLKLEKGFVLLTDSIPTTMRPGKLRRDSEMGVTCVSFSKFDADIFFVGTEGGNVFKCSMSATKRPSKDFTSDMELVSPVTLALQPHIGPVYSVDCSPHHRNILMSCGTDTTVNVRSALQVEPLLTLETNFGYLFDAKWSSTRPMVIFLSTETGKLLIYDLKANQLQPCNVLDVNSSQRPVYALELNPKRPQLVATGDANGDVCIWALNDTLMKPGQNESHVLDNLANQTQDNVTASLLTS